MAVLVVSTNYGVEQDELLGPVEALRDAGINVLIAAEKDEPIQTLVSDKDPGRVVTPDTTIDRVSADDYALLVVPGGTINADALRLNADAVRLATEFAGAGKTVAAICHGPWLLVEAGVLGAQTLTSYPSLATDIRNAGGTWVDEELVRSEGDGWTLLTSRTPDDLAAFDAAVVDAAR
ncbi:DJ-1/PfpI/YhbO family deglycase/protease [Mycetocola reblochoni]|uniref:ThiJ/PfpI family protein n=2 Tax=Mycetocola reblochoni TaxID=331618 RepID=A0A1R4KDI2_9MICO|nr:DJ-1/PfpI/YhbO family deglycase/protease [Mycetocola reblochoni]RLP69003.1 DJ-1/PfpI/YhbO family deglycase/protease [Mycetocola reblochoni]SJN42337.1 ThiJ/PfpI family protein [Mycetocola reblochoni REB411]